MAFRIPVTGVFDNGKEMTLYPNKKYNVLSGGQWYYNLKFNHYDTNRKWFVFDGNENSSCTFLDDDISNIVKSI